MRRFIKKTVLFSLPILLGGVLLELVVRAIPNDYSYKNRYLENHASEIEVLVLGSSHSFFGIDPEHFRCNGFNAAHVSQSLSFDDLILSKFLPHCSNLKAVVIPVSCFSLFGRLEDSIEHWRIKKYVLYYGFSSGAALTDRSELLGGDPSTLIRQAAKYMLSGGTRTSRTVSDLGYGIMGSAHSWQGLEISGAEAAERHEALEEDYLHIDVNVAALEHIVSACRARGIQVFLFMPPAWKTYTDRLNDDQLQTTQRYVDALLANYPNARYHSFLRDARFSEQDFYDADHMNRTGAAKLTGFIDSLLDLP